MITFFPLPLIIGSLIVLSIITHYLAYKKNFFSLEQDSNSYMKIYMVLLAFLMLFCTYPCIQSIISLIVSEKIRRLMWSRAVYVAVLLFLTMTYPYLLGKKIVLSIYGLPAQRWTSFLTGVKTWILAAPTAWLCTVSIDGLLQQLGLPLSEQKPVLFLKAMQQHNKVLFVMYLILIVCVGPFIEEFFFRGFLQNSLKKYGQKVAILVTSIFFGLAHFSISQQWSNVTICASIVIFSFYLGFLYAKTKNIWAPFGLHVTFNAAHSLFLILDRS